MYRVQTLALPRIQHLGGVIPSDRNNGNSPETCQEALNLFESREQLGQAIWWFHNKCRKLEQKERENKIKAIEWGKGIFIPGTWGVRPDQWEQMKQRWEEKKQRTE